MLLWGNEHKKAFPSSFIPGKNRTWSQEMRAFTPRVTVTKFINSSGGNVMEDKRSHLGSKFLRCHFLTFKKYVFTSCSLCWVIGFLLWS